MNTPTRLDGGCGLGVCDSPYAEGRWDAYLSLRESACLCNGDSTEGRHNVAKHGLSSSSPDWSLEQAVRQLKERLKS